MWQEKEWGGSNRWKYCLQKKNDVAVTCDEGERRGDRPGLDPLVGVEVNPEKEGEVTKTLRGARLFRAGE